MGVDLKLVELRLIINVLHMSSIVYLTLDRKRLMFPHKLRAAEELDYCSSIMKTKETGRRIRAETNLDKQTQKKQRNEGRGPNQVDEISSSG